MQSYSHFDLVLFAHDSMALPKLTAQEEENEANYLTIMCN